MIKKIKLSFLILNILVFSLISCSTTSEEQSDQEERTCGGHNKYSKS